LEFFGRLLWHIRKQGEVLGTEGIVPDSAWVSNDSAGNRSRQEISWSVKKGPGFIPERMSGWGKIIPSFPGSKGLSNLRRKEEIKSR
jgi:hypothetical protein